MRARTSESICRMIHQFNELINGAAQVLRDYVGTVVAGYKHDTVKQIDQAHFLTHGQTDGRGIAGNIKRCRGDGADIFRIPDVQGQQRGHDLGCGCGVALHVRVLLKDHVPGIRVDQDRRRAAELRGFQIFGMVRIIGRSFTHGGGKKETCRKDEGSKTPRPERTLFFNTDQWI